MHPVFVERSSTDIFFFDAESTGIPHFKLPSEDPSQPHLVELCGPRGGHECSGVVVMDAIILPFVCDDRTLESLINEALDLGMVPCSLMKGPFRIGFFNPDHIPAGWAKFGAVEKDAPKCAA